MAETDMKHIILLVYCAINVVCIYACNITRAWPAGMRVWKSRRAYALKTTKAVEGLSTSLGGGGVQEWVVGVIW